MTFELQSTFEVEWLPSIRDVWMEYGTYLSGFGILIACAGWVLFSQLQRHWRESNRNQAALSVVAGLPVLGSLIASSKIVFDMWCLGVSLNRVTEDRWLPICLLSVLVFNGIGSISSIVFWIWLARKRGQDRMALV